MEMAQCYRRICGQSWGLSINPSVVGEHAQLPSLYNGAGMPRDGLTSPILVGQHQHSMDQMARSRAFRPRGFISRLLAAVSWLKTFSPTSRPSAALLISEPRSRTQHLRDWRVQRKPISTTRLLAHRHNTRAMSYRLCDVDGPGSSLTWLTVFRANSQCTGLKSHPTPRAMPASPEPASR